MSRERHLAVKERDAPSPRTTLEAWIAGRPRLVATSAESNLAHAMTGVRDDLIRQLADHTNRTEPRHKRSLRSTLTVDGGPARADITTVATGLPSRW